MNKLLPFTYIALFFAFTSLKAQNLPYLNASTGNKNDFIVDADSNIIMFHGSKVEKIDKNYNLIWANSYSDLKIKNLLLSKTGSLFFISNSFNGTALIDRVGKIEANGTLSWSKELPTYTVASTGTQIHAIENADQLFLDRNNHLIVTGASFHTGGDMYLLKLDTLGSPIDLRLFQNNELLDVQFSSIISDVSGIYTISSWGYGFEGPVHNLVLKYSDITNSIVRNSISWTDYRGNMNQTPISSEQIIKSKNEDNTFYLAYKKGVASSTLYNNTFNLKKFRDTTLVWGIEFLTTAPYLTSFQDIEEDHIKNVFLSISTKNINTDKTDKWIVKVDSAGISDNVKHNFMQNFGKATFGAHDSITQLKHHYGNKYFYSIQSSTSLTSPLSVIKMDSTIGSYCSPSATISVSLNPQIQPYSSSQNTLTAVSSVSMQSMPSTVTNLTSYSITISSCIAANINDHAMPGQLSVYPNPAGNEISINTFDNYSVDGVSIFDVAGKCVLANGNGNIDVSKLNTGLYFIKIKTDKGEFSRKFIKE